MEKTIKSFREGIQKDLNMSDEEFSLWTGMDLSEIYSWDNQEAGVNLSQRSLFLVRIWMVSSTALFQGLSRRDKKIYVQKISVEYEGFRYSLIEFLKRYQLSEVKNYLSMVENQSKILFQ